jgi:hypothetical protein
MVSRERNIFKKHNTLIIEKKTHKMLET